MCWNWQTGMIQVHVRISECGFKSHHPHGFAPALLRVSFYKNKWVMNMNYEIVMATEEDREEIFALYKMQIGREFCPWTDDYPSHKTIDFDLARDALFVLKSDGVIKATIALDEDENVNNLTCWDSSLEPEGELSRIAVLPEEQNKGYGRIMMKFGMEELKRRGYKGIHILVNKHNAKAIQCYSVLGFNVVGECFMYEEDFLCYEREL